MHGGWPLMIVGFLGVLAIMFVWWRDVIHEATFQGYHTPVVQIGLRYGMALFIASEVMFFVAFFWAFFSSSLFPVGGVWPPKGIHPFDPFDFPFLNTLILLLSGTTVTWAHHSLLEDDRNGLIRGLASRCFLGLCFTSVQAYEYSHAAFGFTGGIYPSTFFMATGFHGFHVIIGTTFLAVCLAGRSGHFRPIIISASRPRPGIGTSSTWSGCSCSSASTGGAAACRNSRDERRGSASMGRGYALGFFATSGAHMSLPALRRGPALGRSAGCDRLSRLRARFGGGCRRRAGGVRDAHSRRVVVGMAVVVEFEFAPPIWVHLLVLTPIIVGGAMAFLRPMKADLIALQYRHHLLGPSPRH